MSQTPTDKRWFTWGQFAFGLIVAAITFGIMLLRQNIADRKEEAKQTVFQLAPIQEDTIDPSIWGKNFPRQYDSYRRTVDMERTRHGGSEAFQKLDEDPRWRVLFKGYPFGVDYREERGHAYMLSDQDETERVTQFKQPAACLHCHSSIIPAYYEAGIRNGVPKDAAHRQEAIMKGFEVVCAMPLSEGRKLVSHPVSCVDCHAPDTMALRVTRPGFILGIQALAESNDPLPHLPSIERWRKGARKSPYDPNLEASRQEMRSMACAQCHVEYYFQGEGKLLTYPWHRGIKAEQIESYYDEVDWKDWLHPDSGTPLLKAQHPEFEMWSQGIHARSGVSCADCHMPYKREGAIKVSDHHVRSPLLNISRACQTCHHYPEQEILGRVTAIQDRTKALMLRAEDATVELIHYLRNAKQSGRTDEELKEARALHRKAQWRLDFVAAENSMGFHAPGECARLLGEAIDYARQGQVKVLEAGNKK
ncbi:MAG TPA: ammonia-forming cytochrome c nitrite reductase subunit c552 [Gemmatales bacterium]|nr:ammonia-forming cytochrome c nitrite reductase subunit c552 [Gemmatales bacterium]